MRIGEFNENQWHDMQNPFTSSAGQVTWLPSQENFSSDPRYQLYERAASIIDRILSVEKRRLVTPVVLGLELLQFLCHLQVIEEQNWTYRIVFDTTYSTRNPLSHQVYNSLHWKAWELPNPWVIQQLVWDKIDAILQEQRILAELMDAARAGIEKRQTNVELIQQ